MTDFGYCSLLPMKLKSEAGYTLQDILKEIGIQIKVTLMGPRSLSLTNGKRSVRKLTFK
jgi:hypothetical protein